MTESCVQERLGYRRKPAHPVSLNIGLAHSDNVVARFAAAAVPHCDRGSEADLVSRWGGRLDDFGPVQALLQMSNPLVEGFKLLARVAAGRRRCGLGPLHLDKPAELLLETTRTNWREIILHTGWQQ